MRRIETALDIQKTCYLFFDYDDTVLLNGTIPEEHIRAMEAARSLGHKLIVNTGRGEIVFRTNKESQKIMWDGTICGASDLRYEGKILEQIFISWEDFYPWFELSIKMRARLVYSGLHKVIVWNFNTDPNGFPDGEKETWYQELQKTFAENPLLKLTYRAPIKEGEYPKTRLTVVDMHTYADIFAPGCNKGTALKLFCEKAEIPLSQCVCFGDSENDLDVFRVCPTSICMKHAPEALASLATYHAKTDFGVAEGIRYLFGLE